MERSCPLTYRVQRSLFFKKYIVVDECLKDQCAWYSGYHENPKCCIAKISMDIDDHRRDIVNEKLS